MNGAETGIAKATLVGFRPGNIISDAVFFNKATMSASQIQTFFNGKVARCQTGYICLKDARQDTPNRPADQYCSGYSGARNESAATIIYRVSQACGINPQVLIVMLQKEQSLVTHTYPSQSRYDKALGQGCPDTAPCDPAFAGFFYQIYGAARQMQIYAEGRWFTWYAPGKTWNIRYDTELSCGSSPVYIENTATAALYYYTPYQPTAAALAAGYGSAEPCGAYGNRNFYNYFTDWFGSTQVPTGPSLASVNQSSYIAAVDTAGTLWGYPFAKGVWGNAVKLGTGIGATNSVMIPGDLNGDGNRDILVRRGTQLMLLPGTGNSFGNGVMLNVDWTDVALSSAAGDLDGDGAPDVLTTNAAGDLLLWRGDDRGGLLPAVRVGWGWGAMNLIVGNIDLNRDGNSDIASRDSAGRLWAFYGDGRGGWISQVQLGQGWSGMTTIFSPGDFTGDGTSDVVGRTSNGDLWLYPGNGAGGITSAGKIGSGWNGMSAVAGSGAAVVSPRALQAGAGDVDRDLRPDVLALTAQGTLNLYRGDGSGGWRGSQQIGSGWAAGDRMLAMGDFTGDGYKDIGRVTASGQFFLIPGLSQGGYGAAVSIGNGWQAIGLLTAGIDFDGDRNADVIGRDSSGQLILYRGNGRGGWANSGTPIGTGWAGFTVALHAGDFDGDGRSDLILRAADSSLWLYPTNGRGGWGNPRQVGYGWGGFTAIFGAGDFDGDGTSDVMARASTGTLHLFRGNGRGGWGATSPIGWGWGGFSALN